MKKSAPASGLSARSLAPAESPSCVSFSALEVQIEDYLDDCECGQYSQRTIGERRRILYRLRDFLSNAKCQNCDVAELRRFFATLKNLKTNEPMRPVSADAYRRAFSAFFNWLVQEEVIEVSPILRVKRAPVKLDKRPPLTLEQVQALADAIERQPPAYRARDKALFLLLLDTGLRAGEIASLRRDDLDLTHGTARVFGKGNKERTVYFQRRSRRAMHHYLDRYPTNQVSDFAVFRSISGLTAHEALTRSGIYQIVRGWFQVAGIKNTKKGPHLLRSTFAVEYLRAGGREKELMSHLGHEDLTMTHRYANLTDADAESQHRKCSPVERLKL